MTSQSRHTPPTTPRSTSPGHPTSSLIATSLIAAIVPVCCLLPLLASAAPAPTSGESASSADVAALSREVAILRDERQRWLANSDAAGGSREQAPDAVPSPEVTASANHAAAEGLHGAGITNAESVDRLLAELLSLQQSGLLRERFLVHPQRLAGIVLGELLEANQADRAMSVLRDLQAGIVDGETIARIGKALLGAKDISGAREAFLTGIRHGEEDWEIVKGIAAIDPEAGLAELRTTSHTDAFGPEGDFATKELELLFACNRLDEARASLTNLVAESAHLSDAGEHEPPTWLNVLLERAPRMAIELLESGRVRIANPAEAALTKAKAWHAAGNSAAATQALTAMIREEPDSDRGWALLAEVDAEEALRLVETMNGPDPEGSIAARRADFLHRLGRTEEARSLLTRANGPQSYEAGQVLLRIDRDLAIAKARTNRDDELLGDAADLAWQAGNREGAIQLWRESARIDPRDGEWRSKLRQVSRGRDPLGNN